MAKGYQENKDRIEAIVSFGKSIGKRAGFTCEWCKSKDELRVWDYQPDLPPNKVTIFFQGYRENTKKAPHTRRIEYEAKTLDKLLIVHQIGILSRKERPVPDWQIHFTTLP